MHQPKLRGGEIGNKEMPFTNAAALPFLLGALWPKARLVTLCRTIDNQAIFLQQLLLRPHVDVVWNRRAREESGCKFFAFTIYLFAPIFFPIATPIFHVSSHDGRLDSVAAIGFGLRDAATTFHQGDGAERGKGVCYPLNGGE